MTTGRRSFMASMALALSAVAARAGDARVDAKADVETDALAAGGSMLEPGSATLAELTAKLAAAPRRRDFKTVPMILTSKDEFDAEAIAMVLASRCEPRQVWNNDAVEGYWLTVMRNALNTQIWGWSHPDFLVVSATHGSAGLALYDTATWDKYGIGALMAAKHGDRFKTNFMLAEPPGGLTSGDASNYEKPDGLFAMGAGDTIPVLMRRGTVFMACHNAIWSHAGMLIRQGRNPDGLSQEALAAELTNHLVPGTILTPGVVGTLPELQRAGFSYASI